MSAITATVTRVVTTTVRVSTAAAATQGVQPQGGVLEGVNPTHWDKKNPIILFIIQAGIIIGFCRLLHYPLSKIRQPRVIAEVIGGILLGQSVMGRIPGFTKAIFPTESIPSLNLVANLGLVLFLFLVGLEVDLRYFVSNWKPALMVGAAGMALPFGLGCALAWGLYNHLHNGTSDKYIGFGTYMLFIGVAMAITAFPVLCRILTELKLLNTHVGLTVLSAGIANDVVGWILLALCVALVNAGSGLTALWVLLTCVGYALFLAYAVRPVFLWILRRNHSLQNGPSQSMICLTLMIALTSSFFTGIIGVHPIFGAFMAGLICPHEGAFRVRVTEKIEDLVSAIFLPLFFALSGLSTNLGLLDSGLVWGYVFAVIAVAFFGKFAGGTLAARISGCVWRESCTIGVLMSCKGLVELIVLNIGLQAGILNQQTFTIFVVMALVTTFATTPLTAWLYPLSYQRKVAAWRRGEIDWATGAPLHPGAQDSDAAMYEKHGSLRIESLLLYLRLDSLPATLSFISLLGGKPSSTLERKHSTLQTQTQTLSGSAIEEKVLVRPVTVHGLRLTELTDRSSSVMMVSETEEFGYLDPILNAFHVLGQLYNLAISGQVEVVPESSYARTLTTTAANESADMILLPWTETGSISETEVVADANTRAIQANEAYTTFVQKTFERAQCNVAVLISMATKNMASVKRPLGLHRSISGVSARAHRDDAVQPLIDRSRHIFMPYFGGADDRTALRLVLQLAENPDVTASIVQYQSRENGSDAAVDVQQNIVTPKEDVTTLPSDATSSSHTSQLSFADEAAFFSMMQRSLPQDLQQRVVLESVISSSPLADALEQAKKEVGHNLRNAGDVIVVGRRGHQTSRDIQSSSMGVSCLGRAADAILSGGLQANIVVVQAFHTSS